MRGIPTVLITVSPEVSAQMRPPRALYPKGFKIGNSLGRPGMRELQRERSSLTRKANYSSYAAIAFQLFGLMLILTKDLLKERQSS